jgi:hypothetical protein
MIYEDYMDITNKLNDIKKIWRNHGAIWQNIIIIGLRDESNSHKDIYNDFIIVANENEAHIFNASTDPGVYYTNNPIDSEGCAHLCYGYYPNAYIIGIHAKGTPWAHEALVQRGNKVTIWRDKNKNFQYDENEIIQSGYFGINIHKNLSDINHIGKSSAGCQVIQYLKDFDFFMKFIKSNKKEQNKFSYLLVNIKECSFL